MIDSGVGSKTQDSVEQLPTFGIRIHRYDRVRSTQDTARTWVEQGAVPGTIVTARSMTAGRGRRGRIWHAPTDANLSMTAIAPPVSTDIIWQVPLIVGMAVADAITDAVPSLHPALRFPNDILLEGRKAAGILVETAPQTGKGPDMLLIGIGINILNAPLPPEVAEHATSLEAQGGPVSLTRVEEMVLSRLTGTWTEWRTQGIDEMMIRYHSYLAPEARRIFVVEGKAVPCRVERIFANGAVLIETEEGVKRAFHAAQVVLGDE